MFVRVRAIVGGCAWKLNFQCLPLCGPDMGFCWQSRIEEKNGKVATLMEIEDLKGNLRDLGCVQKLVEYYQFQNQLSFSMDADVSSFYYLCTGNWNYFYSSYTFTDWPGKARTTVTTTCHSYRVRVNEMKKCWEQLRVNGKGKQS